MMQHYYFNRLPHFTPIAASYFITIRLHDSLPQVIFHPIKQAYDQELKSILESTYTNEEKAELKDHLKEKYFKNFKSQLDRQYGACFLSRSLIAECVIAKLYQYDKKYYDLCAYTIMPNHIHFLIDTAIQSNYLHDPTEKDIISDYRPLPEIMKLVKGGSSFRCNKILDRKGSFWAPAYFDRIIRNDEHLNNTINYILYNPIKSGIVSAPGEHPYTWIKT